MIYFFCEYCKQEVRARDRLCPSCGKFFYRVRCPGCNYQGQADHFLLGCPKCGYNSHLGVDNLYEKIDLLDPAEMPIQVKRPVALDRRFTLGGGLFFIAFLVLAVIFFVSR